MADRKATSEGEGAAASAPASGVPDAAKEVPDVFLSRDTITKARAACALELKGSTSIRVSAEGGTSRVLFSNSTGRNCFMGMQSDKAWAVVRGAGPTSAEVEVQPNPTRVVRSTRLVIASANDRWTLVLTQAPGAQDLEEYDLEEAK